MLNSGLCVVVVCNVQKKKDEYFVNSIANNAAYFTLLVDIFPGDSSVYQLRQQNHRKMYYFSSSQRR